MCTLLTLPVQGWGGLRNGGRVVSLRLYASLQPLNQALRPACVRPFCLLRLPSFLWSAFGVYPTRPEICHRHIPFSGSPHTVGNHPLHRGASSATLTACRSDVGRVLAPALHPTLKGPRFTIILSGAKDLKTPAAASVQRGGGGTFTFNCTQGLRMKKFITRVRPPRIMTIRKVVWYPPLAA